MEEELAKDIRKLTKAVQQSNNLWWTFLRGAFNGFGVIVGAALLVAILLYILSKIEGWAYIGQYAHNIVEIIRKGK